MAKFNFNLRSPGKLTNCPIYLIIRYEGEKLVYPTNETIPPEFWDKEKQRAKNPKSYPDGPYLNERLDSILLNAQKTYRRFQLDHDQRIPTISELRKELNVNIRDKSSLKGITFFEFIEKYIKEAEGRTNPRTGKSIARSTIQIYKHTFELLKEYSKARRRTIDFRDVDLDFYYDFVEFLRETRKLSNNTIDKHIVKIKGFLNDATERGLNESVAYRSRKFQITGEVVEKIYLTENELTEIAKLDLSDNKRLDKVRDLFLIGCWTGLRFSDLENLSKENIKDGIIEVKTKKTGEIVAIPILPPLVPILKKYEIGGELLLPNTISNAKMNEYIKEVAGQVPVLKQEIKQKISKEGVQSTVKRIKAELVTAHTARRSFATNVYLSGYPAISLMKITGHRTESSFLEYIKITPKENAELLRKHWEERIKKENENS